MSDLLEAPEPLPVRRALSWIPVLVALCIGIFGFGATYATIRSDLTENRTESLRVEADLRRDIGRLEIEGSKPGREQAAKLQLFEARLVALELSLAQDHSFNQNLELRMDSMDRHLLILVCKSDPKHCGDH